MRSFCPAVPASAGSAPSPLFYHAYAAGCEPDDEPHLELVHALHCCFDAQYPSALLVFVLRELNPPLLLLAVDEPGGTVRRDWPWLRDEHLDALEARCRYYLGAAPTAHEAELQNLLLELVPVSDPALGYRVKSLREVA